MFYKYICLLSAFSVWVVKAGLPLPPYIKPCSLSDPNFEKCCLDHGREALPTLLKGDKKYKIPNLIPLIIPAVTVDAGSNLKIYLKDIHAYGIERADLQQVKMDQKRRKLSIKLNLDNLQLIGKYDIDGQILILPIKGQGDINITAVDGKYEYKGDYDIKNENGEDHFVLSDNGHLNFKVGRAFFQLDNLFGGDEALGNQMNKFLNENWEDVLREVGGAISKTVESIIQTIVTGIFGRIAFKELFLD